MRASRKLAKLIIERLVAEHVLTAVFDNDIDSVADTIDKSGIAIETPVSRAGHYLCESDDLTIEQQIELIKAQADINPNEMIDDVEGVIVWQNVENTFNCVDFLNTIDDLY